MAGDEVQLTIVLDRGLSDTWTLCELMEEERVRVVSVTRATAEQVAPAPRRNHPPLATVLLGAEQTIDAAIARFRQVSDARVDKLPPGSP